MSIKACLALPERQIRLTTALRSSTLAKFSISLLTPFCFRDWRALTFFGVGLVLETWPTVRLDLATAQFGSFGDVVRDASLALIRPRITSFRDTHSSKKSPQQGHITAICRTSTDTVVRILDMLCVFLLFGKISHVPQAM